MGLRLNQIVDDEPVNDRSKRVRLSTDRYMFVDPNRRAETDRSNEPAHEHAEEWAAEIVNDDAASAASAGSSSSSVSSSPVSTAYFPMSSRYPSLADSLNILRERLNGIRLRQRLLSEPMRRHAEPQSPPSVSLAAANLFPPSADRAAGRLTRIPSIHRHAHSGSLGSGGRVRFNFPMHHSNPQFVVNDTELNDNDDNDSRLEDMDWNDARSVGRSPEALRRRREIIHELGMRLRETRRRLFGNDDMNPLDHSSFLREFGSDKGRLDVWKKEKEGDVGKVGEECFVLSKEDRKRIAKASKDRFGREMPGGVLWK